VSFFGGGTFSLGGGDGFPRSGVVRPLKPSIGWTSEMRGSSAEELLMDEPKEWKASYMGSSDATYWICDMFIIIQI
jgi:hypothetical protein